MSRVKINLGCGIRLLAGWLNVDAHLLLADLKRGQRTKRGLWKNAVVPPGVRFVRADMRQLPFDNDYADLIECDCAIEHIAYSESLVAVQEMHRVLKSRGLLRIATTNFDALAKLWVERISTKKAWTAAVWWDLVEVIYGNQIHAGEFHRAAFNPRYLAHLLLTAGFPRPITIRVFPTGCGDPPPFEHTRGLHKDMVARTEMIYAEVTKTAKRAA